MGTQTVTPTEKATETLKGQKSVTDLETMDEVTLIKTLEYSPVTTAEEALARVGNDTSKFLAIINSGLKDETRNAMMQDPNHPAFVVDEDGKVSDTPYTGTPAPSEIVNGLVRQLAISIFGYQSVERGTPAADKEALKASNKVARENAVNMIKSTPVMLEGIKKQATALLAKG